MTPPPRREKTREQRLKAAIKESGLPDGEKHLYRNLLDKADYGTGGIPAQFAPTLRRLAAECEKSPATIWRRLGHLEAHGWVHPADPKVLEETAGANLRGPGARIIRELWPPGERCECPRWGGARRRKASHLEPGPVAPAAAASDLEQPAAGRKASHLERPPSEPAAADDPPVPAESVASCAPRASHLDTGKRRILKRVSAGQPADSTEGQREGGIEGGEACAWPPVAIPGVSGEIPDDEEIREALRLMVDVFDGPIEILSSTEEINT